MSKNSLFNKVPELSSRITSFTWGNVVLEASDQVKLADSFLLTAFSLVDFAVSLGVYTEKYDSIVIQWIYRTSTCDVLSLYNSCKSVSDRINNATTYTAADLYEWFKSTWVQPDLDLGHFFVPIKIICTFASSEEAWLRYYLRSFLLHWSKVNLQLPVEDKLVDEYRAFELDMCSWTFPGGIVRPIQRIIEEWFGTFKLDEKGPKHGPGATAFIGRSSRPVKNRRIMPDARLRYVFRRDGDIFFNGCALWERTSELIFVPKSIKTYRTICAEPAALQFTQQWVASSIYSHVNRDHPLASHMDIIHQERSRKDAQRASVMGRSATIDLSNASDSVHVDLVKALFRRTPLYPYLIGTRSEKVSLPGSGEIISLKKFAPMGSALCFPIECIIFAAICEYCYRYEGLGFNTGDYRVYGDDIIVRSDIAPMVIDVLSSLHFTVNHSKTFLTAGPSFRESCGGEYFAGTDITPTILSRKFSGLAVDDFNGKQAAISLANTYFDADMRLCRRVVIQFLNPRSQKFLIPFSTSGEIGLKSENPTNTHLIKRVVRGDRSAQHHTIVTKYEIEAGKVNYSQVSGSELLDTWFIERTEQETATTLVLQGKPVSRPRRVTTPVYLLRG